ncbi:MAG: sulfite reductase flavoprotein subunit alpha [Lautropia sp.]|nr:sulfite reductase flavoprotein subunit alpha [Lautropia sp.]
MNAIADSLLIGYGSESGNARALAQQLAADPALQAFSPQLLSLNEISPGMLQSGEPLIIISSQFGDGEPPANAEAFLALVNKTDTLTNLRYAIFGLGDTGYPQFCGFTKQLDTLLQARGATALINRVDADSNFQQFFAQWLPVVGKVMQGDLAAGQSLHLQVTAYGADAAFQATLLERRALSTSTPGAYHLRLDTTGSGMVWQAGDTAYIIAENDSRLLGAIAKYYGAFDAATLLRHKELRQISKGVLRDLAKMTDNEALKDLLKFKNRKALEDYLWHADILDILQDFCSPTSVPLPELARLLSPCLIRAYSIASPGGAGYIDLCVREVVYEHKNRLHHGTATHYLLNHDGPFSIYCRSNPGFHLTGNSDTPLILIGTGTGIAPLMGLLRQLQASNTRRENCLIFGEKHQQHDFLYRDELLGMQQEGILGTLITAFSRDGSEKYYVQHAMADHAAQLRAILDKGAHVYVCGNKAHLEEAVAQAFNTMMADSDRLPANDQWWKLMQREGRVHLELY